MKRVFRILKWCLLGLKWCALGLLGIVGIFLTVNGVRAAWAGARLNEKIAALQAAGEPVLLADLAREPIAPESNAETYLCRAQKEIEAINAKVYAAFDAASKAEQEAFDAQQPMPVMLGTLRAAFSEYPNAFPLVEDASNCSDYDSQFDFNTDGQTFMTDFLPCVQIPRGIARVAEYRVMVQLDDGHSEEALGTCLVMFRLMRLLDRNPTCVSGLVNVAIRSMAINDTNLVMRSGPLPPSSYAALEQELSRFDMTDCYRQMLRTERALGLQMFHDMSVGVMSPTARLIPWFKNDMCDYVDMMETHIRDGELPYAERNRDMTDAAIELHDYGTLTKLVVPALRQANNAMTRNLAQFRALRVLNALLERERAGATGEPALADLELPPDVTTDPFNDQPLHLKKLPTGWLVYSVGPNLQDDGGDLTEHDPIGYLDFGVGPPTVLDK